MNPQSILKSFLLITFILLAGACGPVEAEVVGGSCDADGDCEEMCLTGDEFPNGMCSLACSTDRDCPGDTLCANKEGGVCLLACEEDSDCPDSYRCKSTFRWGQGGMETMCISAPETPGR